jgi:hypothetical protein
MTLSEALELATSLGVSLLARGDTYYILDAENRALLSSSGRPTFDGLDAVIVQLQTIKNSRT